MKHKISRLFIIILSVMVLTGCWDEKLIRDTSFILGTAFDKKEDKLIGTYATPAATIYPQGGIITTVEGHTVRELTFRVNDKVAETLDTSKIQTLIFSEKIAKEDGLYPYLDIYVRRPNNPINPFIMIVKGDAGQYLKTAIPNENIPSNYYKEIIKAHVDNGLLTHINVMKASRIFKNKKFDILLPHFKRSGDGTPQLDGLAIFNGDKYTGKNLNQRQSIIYNLLDNKKSKFLVNLIVKLEDEENKPAIENYVTINILKQKRKMNTHIKNGKVSATVDLQLDIEVIESPKMNVKKHLRYLTKEIEKDLTKVANQVVKNLQKANSDGLGIEQQLHSFHNKEFKKLDWKGSAYKNADIKANVTVKIKKHGLID
ncbi:MAG: Ger(x)C family spore germination protein [Bacillus sp. (in: firmicutes)]